MTTTGSDIEDDSPGAADVTSEGYATSLQNRHVRMIAIGGAIGVGLFLGSGGIIQKAGPAVVLSYAAAGLVAFLVMRALGELVLYRTTSGSFVEYADEFIGRWAGFTAGWMYWVNWVMTGIAETTAAGLYINYWAPDFPQWITALIAVVVLLTVNLISARLFGELESWFAMLKVLALVGFLIVGIVLIASGAGVGGGTSGTHNISDFGGMFPAGFAVALISLQTVVFSYSGIEMVGITAGETAEPEKIMPRAINSVIYRIAIFYIGSVLLMVLILPWTAYSSTESPFVTVFDQLGVAWIGDAMNLVVLTAALSSCNSGLYSTGRTLRSMAFKGQAPLALTKLNHRRVPYRALLFTGTFLVGGVALNFFVPDDAFSVATAVASLGVITTWATLLYCQVKLRTKALRGEWQRPAFRMPCSPWTNYFALAFLLMVVVLMLFADTSQRIAFFLIPVLVLALVLGWQLMKRRGAPGDGDDPQ